jgi:hypothetical protein
VGPDLVHSDVLTIKTTKEFLPYNLLLIKHIFFFFFLLCFLVRFLAMTSPFSEGWVGLLNPCSTTNLEGLDFIPEFTPLGTAFVWYHQWGLFGLDDPAVSHTTASIAPSLEIGTVLYQLHCSYAEYSTLHKCGYIINQFGF